MGIGRPQYNLSPYQRHIPGLVNGHFCGRDSGNLAQKQLAGANTGQLLVGGNQQAQLQYQTIIRNIKNYFLWLYVTSQAPGRSVTVNRDTITKFRTLFETEKRNLIYSGNFLNEDFHLKQDDLLDEIDMTSSELETAMRMRLRNREALYLKKIDEALRRIMDGTFGECESCGEDIELRRLEARPTTTMCVACKEDEERRERVHIDGHKHKSLGTKLRLAVG